MSLELKIHTKNIHTHIYTCTNFQEHLDIDIEDTCTLVITKLSLISCFLAYFLTRQPPERKEKNCSCVRYKK